MARSRATNIEVAEFAGQLFFRLWRGSHIRTAKALESVGLTTALFAVLNVLGARDGTIQQRLRTDLGIAPSDRARRVGTRGGPLFATLLRRARGRASDMPTHVDPGCQGSARPAPKREPPPPYTPLRGIPPGRGPADTRAGPGVH